MYSFRHSNPVLKSIYKGRASGLSEVQALAAYKSGVDALIEERRDERARLDAIIAKFRESGANRPEGKWDASGIRGVDLKKVAKDNMGLQDIEQFVAFLRMTTKAFGWNVRVIADKSDKRSNGSYSSATNTLTFNIYAGTVHGEELVRTAMPNTISHETVHWMKRNAPEQYQALEDMVFVALKNTSDYDFDAAVKKEFAKYQEKHRQDIDDAEAREEIVARACEDLFGRSEAIKQFLADFAAKNKEAATGFTAAVKRVLAKIKAFFEEILFGSFSRTQEAGIIRRCGVDVAKGLQEQYEKTFFAALEGNAARNALSEFEQGGVRFAESESAPKITVEMSDAERTAILRKKKIVAPVYEGQADAAIAKEKELESNKIGLVKAALLRIGEEFEVFTDYNIKDVEVKITLSKGNLRESVSKDATPAQLAKLLPILKTAVENAVGIESHENRYYYDTYTTSFDNLLGGYEDGEYFVPVRFGLKHGVTGETTLYVVVDQTKIETEVLKTTRPQNVEASVSRSVSIHSIAQIVPFVNSKDLLRYLPDDMLNAEQKKAKWEAIAETIQYTNDKNDKKYIDFIEKGNIRAARDIVKAAAKANGYTIEAYHGTNNREEHSVWNAERRDFDTSYTPFTVFKRQYDEQVGHFFSANKDNAGGYGSTVYSVFLMLKNPLVIECKGQAYNSVSFEGKKMDTYEWAEYAKKHRYDGVIFKDVRDGVGLGDLSELTTDYVVFDSNRIKSADPITYDKDGNVIPISQRFNVRERDIRYSDPEDDVKSDREILAGLLLEDVQDTQEYAALKKYQAKIKSLDQKSREVARLNREIDALRFRKGKRGPEYYEQMDALVKERNKLDHEIRRADAAILKLSQPLQDLVIRERKRAKEYWREKGEKALSEQRERQISRLYVQKIEEKAKRLRKMLVENSEKYHIPDAFKKPVAAFLSLLDFSSERALRGGDPTQKDAALQASFAEVVTLLQSLTDENSSEYLTGLDLPPDAVDEFIALSREVAQMAIDGREGDTMVLRRMSSEQLKTLNSTLYAMTRAVRQANDLFATERFRHVSELADGFIAESEQYAARAQRSKLSDLLSWENMVPYYAFKRFGAAGEALFKGFMQGQDTFAFRVKDIIDFTDKLYTKEEVKAWSKEVHTFDGTNGKVYITTAQIMSLWELWKDKDARQHILGGGGRIQDIALGAKKKYTNDPKGTALGELVVDAMFAKLTPRQKEVADKLQRFMAQECAKWGNEISYKRWGIRIFWLDYYFPIESDKNTVAADVEQRAKENGLFSLLHKSFTKKRVFNANNRIMIRSVFDVFASHTTDMAKYHAFALPLLDMQKFINFKEIVRPEGESEVTTELPAEGEQKDTSFTTKEVRTSMEKAFGTAAYKYIEQFLIDLNGNIGGRSAAEGILQKGITAHKIAAVGANLRVGLLQVTAYVRLLNVMEPKYFFGGLNVRGHLKASVERMQKHAGIALWKSLGYRDTNIAAPIQTKIKHDETWMDTVTEKSMILAELGDKATWGMIWHACEQETRDKHADLWRQSRCHFCRFGLR